jgi:hypothetical protein
MAPTKIIFITISSSLILNTNTPRSSNGVFKLNKSLVVCAALLLSSGLALSEEPVDLDMVNKIRDEGFNRSEVMESLRMLTDEIGPRLPASPGMRAASKWTVEQLQAWGIEDVYLEGFEFGRGWSTQRSEIHMTSPRQTQLYGLPIAWHPGTGGVLEGEIIYAPIGSEDDFEEWEGKLKGKMVLVSEVDEPHEPGNESIGTLFHANSEDQARKAIQLPNWELQISDVGGSICSNEQAQLQAWR